MLTSQRPTGAAGESIGLGFFLGTEGARPSFFHGGANAGYRAFMFAMLNERFGMVLMRNSEAGDELTPKIVDAVIGAYS
jgi:hypothetical protein